MIRIPYQDAPAALFYLSGAAYGTAAGIVSALPIPEPRRYVLRALKVRAVPCSIALMLRLIPVISANMHDGLEEVGSTASHWINVAVLTTECMGQSKLGWKCSCGGASAGACGRAAGAQHAPNSGGRWTAERQKHFAQLVEHRAQVGHHAACAPCISNNASTCVFSSFTPELLRLVVFAGGVPQAGGLQANGWCRPVHNRAVH